MEAAAQAMEGSSYLEKFFNKIINGETFLLNLDSVLPVLYHDVGVELKLITPGLRCVLAECLSYFMISWDGWSEEKIKDPSCKEEFCRMYQEYLKEIIMPIFKREYEKTSPSEESTTESTTDTTTESATTSAEAQAKPSSGKTTPCPISNEDIDKSQYLMIGLLLTLENGKVSIKRYIRSPFNPIKLHSMSYFLNHPYVKITIRLPNVELSRSTHPNYKHYLSIGEILDVPALEPFNTVAKLDQNVRCVLYDFDYILAYFKHLSHTLAKFLVKNHLLIQSILTEYTQDIKECNLNSAMATPCEVTFNIGRSFYIRKKRFDVGNKDIDIKLLEMVIPTISFSLVKFDVLQDKTPGTFADLNIISKLPKRERMTILKSLGSCLILSCTLCNENFRGESCDTECIQHFQRYHGAEEKVECHKCHKLLDVVRLAIGRWKHECSVPQTPGQDGAAATSSDDGPSLLELLTQMQKCRVKKD